jgi:hypothetical protein
VGLEEGSSWKGPKLRKAQTNGPLNPNPAQQWIGLILASPSRICPISHSAPLAPLSAMAAQGQGQGQGQGSFFKRKHEVLSTAKGVSFTSGSPPAGGSIAPPPYSKALPPPPGEIQPPLHAQAIATKRHRVDNSDGCCGGCICGGCICSRSLGSSTSAGE